MDRKSKIIIVIGIVIILFGGLIYLGSQQKPEISEEPSLPEVETEAEAEAPAEVPLRLPANFVFGTIKEVKENSFILETTEEGVKEIKIGLETEIFVGATGEIGSISDIKEGYNAICQMPEEGNVEGNVAEKINIVPLVEK